MCARRTAHDRSVDMRSGARRPTESRDMFRSLNKSRDAVNGKSL